MKKKIIKDCWNCGWGNHDFNDLRKRKSRICGHPQERPNCVTNTDSDGRYKHEHWTTRKTVLKILEQQRLENKSW